MHGWPGGSGVLRVFHAVVHALACIMRLENWRDKMEDKGPPLRWVYSKSEVDGCG